MVVVLVVVVVVIFLSIIRTVVLVVVVVVIFLSIIMTWHIAVANGCDNFVEHFLFVFIVTSLLRVCLLFVIT